MESRPLDAVEVVDQAVGVGGDAHHPLRQRALEHREVADLAATVGGDLLVGQHGAQAGAPVDGRLGQVGQAVAVDHDAARQVVELGPRRAVGGRRGAGLQLGDQLGDRPGPVELGVVPGFEDLQEDPLRPAVVADVGRGDAAPRVVGQAEAAQLAAVRGDVLLGVDARVHAGLDGVLLGRQPERVEAHRVQHVVAGHALVAGVDVGGDVAERVADVQTGARRVREHVEDEELVPAGHLGRIGQRAGGVGRLERALALPAVLPPRLDLLGQRRRVPVLGGVVAPRLGRLGVRHNHETYFLLDWSEPTRYRPGLTLA